jgi:hypothetical protein
MWFNGKETKMDAKDFPSDSDFKHVSSCKVQTFRTNLKVFNDDIRFQKVITTFVTIKLSERYG